MSDADVALMRATLDLVYKENAVLEERLAQVCPSPYTLPLKLPLTSSCTSRILFRGTFAGGYGSPNTPSAPPGTTGAAHRLARGCSLHPTPSAGAPPGDGVDPGAAIRRAGQVWPGAIHTRTQPRDAYDTYRLPMYHTRDIYVSAAHRV